jgi:uncharacterized protein (TIGR03435 family)
MGAQRSAAVLLVSSFLPAFGQAPTFEAAEVKVNKSGEARMAVDFQPGGRFVAHNVPMKILIGLAYGARPDAVKGPGWLDSARFDVVAKASPGAKADELRRMVQSLLAERFNLVVHTEQRESRGYALIQAKGGAKLQASDAALLTDQRCTPAPGTQGRGHFVCRHMTMKIFAATLQEIAALDIDVPVVDQTGITGVFDLKLDWTPHPAGAPATDAIEGPTVFEALENQLGLKLESRKLPLPVIVVDSVERTPIEN